MKYQFLLVVKVGETACECHELWEILGDEKEKYYLQYSWWVGNLPKHTEICAGFKGLTLAAAKTIMDVLVATRTGPNGFTLEEILNG